MKSIVMCYVLHVTCYMKIAKVQFTPWDKAYNFDTNKLDLVVGDMVIVKTELGTELGKVVELKDVSQEDLSQDEYTADEIASQEAREQDDQADKKEPSC